MNLNALRNDNARNNNTYRHRNHQAETLTRTDAAHRDTLERRIIDDAINHPATYSRNGLGGTHVHAVILVAATELLKEEGTVPTLSDENGIHLNNPTTGDDIELDLFGPTELTLSARILNNLHRVSWHPRYDTARERITARLDAEAAVIR